MKRRKSGFGCRWVPGGPAASWGARSGVGPSQGFILKVGDGYFSADSDALPVAIFLDLCRLTSHPLRRSRKSWEREAWVSVPPVGFLIWNLSETSPLWKVPSNFQRPHYSKCQRAWCWGAPLPAGFCHWNSKDHSCPHSALAFQLFTSHQGPCQFCQGIRALPPTIPGANSTVTKWQRMCRNCKRLKADFELSSSWCPWWCLGPMLLTERIGNRLSSLWGCR